MADTHDTIDGLLAEFRGYSAGMPPSYHVTMSWADFRKMLDRLEAAHKLEIAEKESVIQAVESARTSETSTLKDEIDELKKQVCDCAKLREALEFCVKGMCGFCRMDAEARGMTTRCVHGCEALRKAKAALAASPRNCDRPECATSKAAQNVWRREDGGKTAYHVWLLAPATEGGNDGNE